MQLNKLIMAKKHTDISDEQQRILADIQANPKLLFTPEYSKWRDFLRRKASNNIGKGVAQTAAGTAGDLFIANEQILQQQGEEPWLINISNQPWAKWNLVEDVPYIIQGEEPNPRDYANGGRLMITKNMGHKYSGLEPNPSQQMNVGGDWTGQSINNNIVQPQSYQQAGQSIDNNIMQPQSYQQAGQRWNMGIDNGLVGGTSNVQQIPTSKLITDSAINLGNNTIQILAAQQAAQNIAAGKAAADGAGFFSRMGSSFSGMGSAAAGAGIGAGISLLQNVGKNEQHDDGMMDRLDPMAYLANGRHSIGGDITEKLGVGMFAAGASTFNPYLMLAGAATKVVGDVVNAGWGHKTDDKALAAAKTGTNYLNNYNSNANSFDELNNPMAFGNVGDVYEGGLFNKKKWNKKNDALREERLLAQQQAQNQFENNLNNLQQDQMYNMSANYAAFGGTLSTQGSDWRTGLTFVNNGGSHESNPYGGVPMGIAQDGQPNLVEEGEVIYDLNGSPYVFSKRLKMSQAFKDKYKFKGETFADAATQAQKEIEERPNDPIAKRGLDDIMGRIAGEQEKERQKRAERQARKQAKQAAYAYGGHIFKKGSYLNGPGKLAYYNGRFYTLNEDDGKWYSEDGKYYISNPSERKGMQFYTGDDFEIEEDWRDRVSNPYPRQQVNSTYTDPLDTIPSITTNWNYTDYVNRMHQEAEAAQARRDYETAVATGAVKGAPLTDQQAGNVYYGTTPTSIQPSYIWQGFLNNWASNPDNPTTTPVTTTTAPTTTTSKKGTGTSTSRSTTTSKGNTNSPVDYGYLLDWMGDDANFAAANAAATKNGARNFKNAADLYKTATTGKPGPAMRGLLSAYNDFQNANRGGVNYSPYNEGSPEIESLSSIPTISTPTLGSISPERHQDTESANRLNYYTYLYGDKAAKKLKKAGFNPDGTRREEYIDNGIADNDSNHRATWMRYAPVIGSALAVITDPWLNKPDYRNADMVLEAGNSAKDVSFRPIGDYLPYKPFDRLFYANQLAAQQGATRRALLNTTGGNASTARGLLLAADNQGINQMGNLWRQAEEYNAAQRQAVADFNRGTNIFNSEGFLKADMANQGQGNVRINAAIEAAKLRELEDNRVAETRSANFTNLFNNLGNIGRENFVWNQVSENPALYYRPGQGGSTIYKGNSDGYDIFQQNMDRWNKEHTAALGGYITIK